MLRNAAASREAMRRNAVAVKAIWSALLGVVATSTCPGTDLGGIDVIVSADGSVVQVPSAGLPDLPEQTRQLSYGGAAVNTGEIILAGPQSLDPTDKWYAYSVELTRAAQLFCDWLNNEKGGIAVGGSRNKLLGGRNRRRAPNANRATTV